MVFQLLHPWNVLTLSAPPAGHNDHLDGLRVDTVRRVLGGWFTGMSCLASRRSGE